MIQQYESLVGLKVDEMIKRQFEQGVAESMEEEVIQESHGNAKFITQDIVSNGMESNATQMQGDIASSSSLF